jgi:hypothetical protein
MNKQRGMMIHIKQFRQNAWMSGYLTGNVCLYWEPEAKIEMLGLPPTP